MHNMHPAAKTSLALALFCLLPFDKPSLSVDVPFDSNQVRADLT